MENEVTNISVSDAYNRNDEDFAWLNTINVILLALTMILSFVGIFANAMNIAVFKKLLKTDPININFLFLSLSDMGICITCAIMMVSFNYALSTYLFLHYKIFSTEVIYLIFGVPHTLFIRISILLTAVLTMGRCICVVLPMKAKFLVTRNTIKICVGISYALGFLVAIPIYYMYHLGWVYVPDLNNTYLRQTESSDHLAVNSVFTPLDVLILQMVPYVMIVVCTVLLIVTLKKRSGWRQSAVSSTTTQTQEDVKENRIVRIVIIISIEFVFCHIPNAVIFLLHAFGSDYGSTYTGGKQWYMTIGMMNVLMDTGNATANIYFYYANSSKFKQEFLHIFGKCFPKKNKN